MWLVWLVACGSSRDLQNALNVANDANAAALVVAELTRAVDAQPASGCPTLTRTGDVDTYTVTAQYDACTPDSKLVPVALSGQVTLAYASEKVTATLADGFLLDGKALSGPITGSYQRQDLDTITLVMSAQLVFPSTAGFDGALTLTDGPEDLVVDGTGSIAGEAYSASSVDIPVAAITRAAPLPSGGENVLGIVHVKYDGQTPTSGDADVVDGSLDRVAHLADIPVDLY